MNMTYGQKNYEAYAEARNWKDYRGEPIPQWNDVRPEIQLAWQIAADKMLSMAADDADPWTLIQMLYRSLQIHKPNDRSERDRRMAILITEIEKSVMPYYHFWFKNGGV